MREVIREIQTTWLAAVPAQIAARTVFKLMIMLHKLKFRHQISGVMCQNVTDYRPVIHIVTEGRAAHPNLPPDGEHGNCHNIKKKRAVSFETLNSFSLTVSNMSTRLSCLAI